MIDLQPIGRRIYELRKQRGLTQTAFAEALHVSPQAVSNWERGIAPPELENLIRIADYFGVSIDDLVRPANKIPLILGIDGGGTKTELVVAATDGRVLNRKLYSGSNPNDIGIEQTITVLTEWIHEVQAESFSPAMICCGIAGVATGDHRQHLMKRLKEKFPRSDIMVDSDIANLFSLNEEAEMAVISGTGSVAFVRSKESFVRLGGWGYLLDSAGSAYDIGRDAVATALAEEDELRVPCATSRFLREQLQVSRVWDAVDVLYADGKPLIASLARSVFQGYRFGDSVAETILIRNVRRLGDLLNLGMQTYHAKPLAVVGGGLFEHYSDVILPLLSQFTKAELVCSDLPPVYGACRRGALAVVTDLPDDFAQTFRESYDMQCRRLKREENVSCCRKPK